MSGKKKRGPPSAEDVLRSAISGGMTEQIQRAGQAVFERIERLAKANEDIPISLLGAARLTAEWHTDYLTVVAAMPDLPGLGGSKEGS